MSWLRGLQKRKMADNVKTGVWIIAGVLFLAVFLGVGTGTVFFGLDKFGAGVMQYIFLGTDDLNEFNITGNLNTIGLLITSLMIWLIVFVTFGDILENFSAFSKGIGWIIAFALAVVAANVKLINTVLVWITGVFLWAGTFAIYAGLFGSIFAFFVVQWGWSRFSAWFITRQQMVAAVSGKTKLKTGVETLKTVAEATTAGE